MSSDAALAVASKYEDLATKHNNALDDVEELHEIVIEEVLPGLLEEIDVEDDPQAEARLRSFVDDRATLFRFYRRARYSVQGALSLLSASLSWRLRTDLDSLSLASLHPLYVSPPSNPPLFWCNTNCKDMLGRPVGVISLKSLERVTKDDGNAGLEECREYIVGCMESVRRYLSHLYGKATTTSRNIDVESSESKPLQMVIIFSLQSSGMANLELELLPFLLDLLKNHFPGMVGAVYIMHYGWVHSGMWGLAKRVLPQQALAKIFFPGAKELPEHFDMDTLPVELGGEWEVPLNDETNNVMKRFARPNLQGYLYETKVGSTSAEDLELDNHSAPPSPRGISGTSSPAVGRSSRAHSRSGSFDSLAEQFYSSSNTPYLTTPRLSGLSTPRGEYFGHSHSTNGNSSPITTVLRMTPTAEEKLRKLQRSRGGQRSRANSDAANKGLGVEQISSSRSSKSPIMSRSTSPNHSRRRTITSQNSRAVHFQGSDQDLHHEDNSHMILSRRGSLRDFRLLQDDFTSLDLNGGDTSGSEESDKSGKVGEIAKDINQIEEQGAGFFARWRRNSRSNSQNVEMVKVAKKDDTEDDLTELEPNSMSSPHLQVPDIEEPPISGYHPNHYLSRRTRKFSNLPGHVSPYNASNPFYGYPAYPVLGGSDGLRRSSSAQRLHFRRRKRDLLRTLMYLFVLRLLSLHRGVRNQILSTYRGLIRAIRVGGSLDDKGEDEGWKEATERYNKLKSATNRQKGHVESKARQAQPLASLGFRKRYAFLILFLFVLLRSNWRSRLFNIREVFVGAAVGKLGLQAVDEKEVIDGNVDSFEKAAETSLTGLHIRKRLGLR